MRQWTGSWLVQVIYRAFRFGTKPLFEPILNSCQLCPYEQTSVKFQLRFAYFTLDKCNWRVYTWEAILFRLGWKVKCDRHDLALCDATLSAKCLLHTGDQNKGWIPTDIYLFAFTVRKTDYLKEKEIRHIKPLRHCRRNGPGEQGQYHGCWGILGSPGHQQAWYWLRTIPFTINGSEYMYIYIYIYIRSFISSFMTK